MKRILLIGAGRSSSVLIRYLLQSAAQNQWELVVGDVSEQLATEKTGGHPHSNAIRFDVQDQSIREAEVQKADLVISLLPPHLHYLLAVDCVNFKKHFLTASYLSTEMGSLHEQAEKAGICIMNECGLDPGIDHMSAMEVIDRLKKEGCELTSFKSYTGGLVAPESNDNPWGYKFSWNPRNVILAGQGTARFIEHGKYRYLPYSRVFTDIEKINVEGNGSFDGYANRDSLSYRPMYHLDKIPTMIRGTLRQSGFCKAWNVFVQLGLTDDSYTIEDSIRLTYAQLVESLLPAPDKKMNLKSRVASLMNT